MMMSFLPNLSNYKNITLILKLLYLLLLIYALKIYIHLRQQLKLYDKIYVHSHFHEPHQCEPTFNNSICISINIQ